jgi:hypothetical protein
MTRGGLRRMCAWLASAVAILVTVPASAHKPSDSYLTIALKGARVEGRWDIALRDLNNVMGLDRESKGAITWGEVRTRTTEIAAFALHRLALEGDGAPCPTRFGDLRVADHSDGTYAVVRFDADCRAAPRALDVDYELFFDVDPQHHGVARIDDGVGTRAALFTEGSRRQHFEIARTDRTRQLASAVALGIHHIFSGIDHLLFLIALLLPSVLARTAGGTFWRPVTGLRPAMMDVLKIVTSFTVAHSITLSLSTLELVRLPSRLVESGIAASVVVAALNNVVPVLAEDRWAAAFALGLLHGFGFSATLVDLGLPRQNLMITLFGFNVGVEIGQLCVVVALFPLAYAARRSFAYRRFALQGGSLAIAALASVWLVERAFALKVF